MKATEARKTAQSIAHVAAEKKSAELKKRREVLKASVPRLRAERIKQIEAKFRERIKYAVEDGERSVEIRLSIDGNDCLRGQYKYLPMKVTDYDYRYYQKRPIRTWYHAYGEGYLKYAPWGKYVKTVLTKLRRDGYKCEVTDVSTPHDDSAAYLNSGGECGSETPYYTKDTVLTISW